MDLCNGEIKVVTSSPQGIRNELVKKLGSGFLLLRFTFVRSKNENSNLGKLFLAYFASFQQALDNP